MDNIGEFLFLIAFVMIAAIQWVVKQIQVRNAAPKPDDDDPLEETWKELEDHFDEGRSAEAFRSPVQEEAPKPVGALGEIRNLFESLRQGEAERQVIAPPPVPAYEPPERPDPRSSLSASEKAALERLKETKRTQIKGRRKSKKTGFRLLLRGSGNLRQAMILKEVFDRPRSLREEVSESLS